MCGVLAGQGGAVGGEFVGNPAAAGHRVKSSRAVAIAMRGVDAAEEAVLPRQRFFVEDAAVQQELHRGDHADQHGHHQPALLMHLGDEQEGNGEEGE